MDYLQIIFCPNIPQLLNILNLYQTTLFMTGPNWNQHFLLFPKCSQPFPKQNSLFESHLFCCLHMLSISTSQNFCHYLLHKFPLLSFFVLVNVNILLFHQFLQNFFFIDGQKIQTKALNSLPHNPDF